MTYWNNIIWDQLNSVQLLNCVWLFETPWTAARQAFLSITNSWSLFKTCPLCQWWMDEPCNHLILCHHLFLLSSNFPSMKVFSNELVLRIRWPKYWEFQLQHQSFQLIFRTDFLSWLVGFPCSSRDSQESSTPQFKSIHFLALSFLYSLTLTSIHGGGGLLAKSCPTLCDPMDCSVSGSSVHGIPGRILAWVAISSPGDFPDPGIELRSPALRADSLPTELQEKLFPTSIHDYWKNHSFD